MNRAWIAFCAVLLPAVALAVEPAVHGEPPAIPWTKLAIMAVNFGLFILILRHVAWPTLRNWIAERRAGVVTALAEAERVKREAQGLRAEWQRRLDRLGGELEAMLRQARADIEAERDAILAAARKTAAAIRRDARTTAENERRAAAELLRGEVAREALAIATRLAPQRLTQADHAAFVDDFLKEVGGQ